LKEVCAALLESDVNVKLASQLRQKVRAKVKAVFEGGGEKAKDANRKNVIQKVLHPCSCSLYSI
jgi:signal recognition particle subunit SRP54